MQYSVNNTRLNVLESGNGSLTLLFLHYFGGSALEWTSVIEQLASQYRCVAVDLRGHGDSEAAPTGYAVANIVDDILALIRTLAIRKYVLIGHSMSGKVALSLASRQPEGLQGLLLVSPSPPLPEPIPAADRKGMLENHGQQAAAEATFAKITVKPLTQLAKGQIIADNLRTSKAAWNAWLIEGSKENIAEQMSAVIVPVNILVGTADAALPPDVQRTMTLPYLASSTTFDTIEATGHLLPWETPDELVAFIQQKIAAY